MFTRVWMSVTKKSASLELKHRLNRGKPIWKAFLKVLAGKTIFYVIILIFTSEISLVISLHDWFILGALAADKNCIH